MSIGSTDLESEVAPSAAPNKHWEEMCKVLRTKVGDGMCRRWIESAEVLSETDDEVRLQVPNFMHQVWLEDNFLKQMEEVLSGLTGRRGRIVCQVAPPTDPPLKPTAVEGFGNGGNGSRPGSVPNGSTPVAGVSRDVPGKGGGIAEAGPVPGAVEVVRDGNLEERLMAARLNPEYTFDALVIGENNRIAAAAAQAIARTPGRLYNPFFVYGGTGLGKTHLMHAIGREVLANNPRTRVLYVTAESFTNDLVSAIQQNRNERFRNSYRQADVLLVDDIHFFAGKYSTQEEFFHTFNALFDGRKQIVLASDRPPSEIKPLEQRLVSRFEWGLTSQIQPPDVETRMAILQLKMRDWPMRLDDSIITYLAEHIRSNVRRLQGALVKLGTYASLHGWKISREETETILRDVLLEEARPVVTINLIQKAVAETFDVRMADMTSRRRPANIVLPRQVAMFLAREMTRESLKSIGEAFGGRDHGTVMHACKLIDRRCKEDEQLRNQVERLKSQLGLA